MKKGLLAMSAALVAVFLMLPASAMAAGAEVRLAPIGRAYAPPPLRSKQGWLTITNRDWQDYTFVESKKGRASLYQGNMAYPGGVVIPSGATITLSLEKDTWEILGNTNDRLKVKVHEGRTSTVTLEPFGYVGNTGLRGISNDGDRVRDEILFDVYVQPPVIIQTPPVVIERPAPPVIIQQPSPPVVIHRPPPPPVIVHRPPVVVERPHHRPPPPRPMPPRPSRPHRDKDWGFTFSFGSR